MPTHDVTFEMPKGLVLSKDIRFSIKSDDEKIGTLLISKGNIEWIPANKSVKKHRMQWEKFAKMMEETGRKARIGG
jgi:hypothetical protein